MKKVLLASTALVGAAVMFAGPATAEVELTVSGGYVFQIGFGDEDVQGDRRDSDFSSDAEIHFNASGTSDEFNFKYGAKIELLADKNSQNNADEAMMWLSGDWGRINLGDEDGAGDNMAYHGASMLAGSGGTFGDLMDYYAPLGGTTSPKISDSGDATKITYFTPRFSGFQLGLSYAPSSGSTGTDIDLENEAGEFEDYIELGANFVDSFEGVDVAVSVAGSFADSEDGAQEDISAWSVGFNVGFSGFTVGAGYADNGDSGDIAGSGTDQEAWSVGAAYGAGPWSVSAGYLQSENGASDYQNFVLSATYAIAPGLNVQADLGFFESDDGAGSSNDGTVFLLGTGVSF